MKNLGYIFFNFEKIKKDKGKIELVKFFAIKTNQEIKTLSSFEKEIDSNNYIASVYEFLSSFEKWVGNPYEQKFITFHMEDMRDFVEICKSVQYKSQTRDFHKIVSYQYWNIQNEMCYRMGLKNENLPLRDLLSIYGLDFIGNESTIKNMCYNTLTLAVHFKLDNNRNNQIFQRLRRDNNKENKNPTPNQLDLKPTRYNVDEMLKEKLNKGWSIVLKCSHTKSPLPIIYEATATNEEGTEIREGKGKTLELLLIDLFQK